MGTIQSYIRLHSGIARSLQRDVAMINQTVNRFHGLRSASENMMNTSSIDAGTSAVERAAQAANRTEQGMDQASQSVTRMQQQLDGVGRRTQDNINHQNNYNKSVNSGSSAVSSLLGKAKKMAVTLGTTFGAKRVIGLSDTMASTQARLNLMNDGLQTTNQLNQMIYQSAQDSRGSYQSTADAVTKMALNAGNAFKNNAEVVAFMEQINKQFVIGGASAVESSNAIIQLGQAMAAGTLRGDELNSILEAAPEIARAIEKSMGWAEGSIKSYAEEGEVTAEVVKNSMLNMADETNKKFNSMPMTFGQVMTSIQNKALMSFQPVLKQINEIANSKNFDHMVDGTVEAISTVASVATAAFGWITSIAGFMYDNWSIIGPIIFGVVTVLGGLKLAMLAVNGVQLIGTAITRGYMIAKGALMVVTGLLTGAEGAATVAQQAFNSALLACPITWILIAIVALIAIFYAAVAAVNKFAGTSISATGILVGVFATAGAFIGNTVIGVVNAVITWFVTLWNFIAAFANFFANVFNDPVAAIEHLFLNLFNCILDIVSGAAGLIDKITGSDLSGSIDGFQNKVNKWAQNKIPEQKEYVKTLDPDKYTINKRIAYGDAYKAGYDWGKNLGKSKKVKTPKVKSPKITDYGKMVKDPSSAATAANTGKTAANTAKTANSVSATQEDLSYLRDIAEQEAINQITSPIINVEMTNNNTVNSGMDLDGISSMLRSKVEEEMYASAEGVY